MSEGRQGSRSGADKHILVQCTDVSQVRINWVEAHVVRVETPPAGRPGPGFFEPVRLTTASRSRTANVIDLPPGARRFFSVLTQVSEHSSPWFSGEGQPLDYEFLFDRSGAYQIHIEAHGEGTTVAAIVLELELERRDKLDANRRPHTECEILSVRQKDLAEP